MKMTNIAMKIDENAGAARRDARLLDLDEAVRCEQLPQQLRLPLQIALFKTLHCSGDHRNPVMCGTNQGS